VAKFELEMYELELCDLETYDLEMYDVEQCDLEMYELEKHKPGNGMESRIQRLNYTYIQYSSLHHQERNFSCTAPGFNVWVERVRPPPTPHPPSPSPHPPPLGWEMSLWISRPLIYREYQCEHGHSKKKEHRSDL
jgi:hypothetical protein